MDQEVAHHHRAANCREEGWQNHEKDRQGVLASKSCHPVTAHRAGAALKQPNMSQPGELNAHPPKRDPKGHHEERVQQIPLAFATGRPPARIADKRSRPNLAHCPRECPRFRLFSHCEGTSMIWVAAPGRADHALNRRGAGTPHPVLTWPKAGVNDPWYRRSNPSSTSNDLG